jgi:hypothetical protein
MDKLMDNAYFVSLLAWPGVIVGCALINMLCQWSFSWSELVLDYLAGIAVGLCFYFGTKTDADGAAHFFLVFSQGLFGLLHVLEVDALKDRADLFAISAGCLGGSVLLAGLLDLASRAISTEMTVGNGLLSILIAPLKLPWSFCTTAVGTLLFLAGLVWYIICKAKEDKNDPTTIDKAGIGHMGGIAYIEWNPKAAPDFKATTLGATVMVWSGSVKDVIKHELYHTRQYAYLHDWMIPFWLLGGLWGMISAAIHNAANAKTDPDIPVFCSFSAARHDKEVGNPLERAAYAADGKSPCV